MNIRIGDMKVTELQREYVNEILDNNKITEGPFVEKLEREMEKYLGVKNAILVTNGTVGLQLVGHFMKQMAGRPMNILIPALTFPATLNAFVNSGHNCVICDINEDMQINIDSVPEEVKKAIDVVVPVHLMGYSADMNNIKEQAKKYNWFILEDACEAFGGEYDGKKVGTLGNFGVYSFYVSHNIPGGELGMVVTDDDEAAEILRSMKNHGRAKDSHLDFKHDYIGSNYKTTEFSAALVLAEKDNFDKIIETRLNNCKYMFDNITNPDLDAYHCPDGFSPLGFPIDAKTSEKRKTVTDALNAVGIETRHIFPFLGEQKAYNIIMPEENFKNSMTISKSVFYVPCHQLLTKADLEAIVKTLNEVSLE